MPPRRLQGRAGGEGGEEGKGCFGFPTQTGKDSSSGNITDILKEQGQIPLW